MIIQFEDYKINDELIKCWTFVPPGRRSLHIFDVHNNIRDNFLEFRKQYIERHNIVMKANELDWYLYNQLEEGYEITNEFDFVLMNNTDKMVKELMKVLTIMRQKIDEKYEIGVH